jgi:hypothetical protein
MTSWHVAAQPPGRPVVALPLPYVSSDRSMPRPTRRPGHAADRPGRLSAGMAGGCARGAQQQRERTQLPPCSGIAAGIASPATAPPRRPNGSSQRPAGLDCGQPCGSLSEQSRDHSSRVGEASGVNDARFLRPADDHHCVDRREIDPPIQVEIATWSPGGQLDWWVRERQWWGRVRGADGRQRWVRAVDLRPVSGSQPWPVVEVVPGRQASRRKQTERLDHLAAGR